MIATERLVLRPFAATDLDAFVAYRRDPAVARYQSWDGSFGRDDAAGMLDPPALGTPGAWVQLAITAREDGALLGDCGVRVLADQPATAELGITLAPPGQGRGVAREALDAVIGTLFAEHGMHRVFAEADDRNAAVHRLLERLGFRCEARLVEADWFKGEWTTLRIYAVLAREWERS
jgi:RimJ/RimL family protein N-acetyltransferase